MWKILIGASIVTTIVIAVILYKKKKDSESVNSALSGFNSMPSLSGSTQIGDMPSSVTSGIRDPRPLINQIYESLDGFNLMVYPEIVNKLANLSIEELTIAYDYFNEEFGGITGETLYEFIKDEAGSGTYYAEALERLERHSLT